MLKYLSVILILTIGSKVCHSQKDEKQILVTDRNYFEVFYPNYYYFYRLDRRFHPSLPLLNIGFNFKSFNSKSSGISLGLSSDYMRDLESVKSTGEIAERLALYPSIGFHKSLLFKNPRLFLSLEGNLIGRIGQITTFGSSNEFETVFGFYDLLDFGFSAGSRLTFSPNNKICFTIGIKHSFFAFVLEKKNEFYDFPSSPRNVTTLTLGVGLNFARNRK